MNLNDIAKYIPRYFLLFLAFLRHPVDTFSARSDPETYFEDALLFLSVSIIISSTMYFYSGTSASADALSAYIGAFVTIAAYVILLSTALRIALFQIVSYWQCVVPVCYLVGIISVLYALLGIIFVGVIVQYHLFGAETRSIVISYLRGCYTPQNETLLLENYFKIFSVVQMLFGGIYALSMVVSIKITNGISFLRITAAVMPLILFGAIFNCINEAIGYAIGYFNTVCP